MNTALAIEAYVTDLRIQWDNTIVVRPVKRTQAYIAETFEIMRRQNDEKLLNDRTMELPTAWKYALE